MKDKELRECIGPISPGDMWLKFHTNSLVNVLLSLSEKIDALADRMGCEFKKQPQRLVLVEKPRPRRGDD